jgi:hypothetical protein
MMSTTPRISRDLDAAREAYDQVIVVSNFFLQLMACSTLCGRRKYRLIMPGCVLCKCIKFILSPENVVIAMSITVWMPLCKASRFCDFTFLRTSASQSYRFCRLRKWCCPRLPVPRVLGWIRRVLAFAGMPSRQPFLCIIRLFWEHPGRALCSCFCCWLRDDTWLRLFYDF